MPNCWYEDRALGINSIIRPIINCLCTLAGFTERKFMNGSLLSGSCTCMFDHQTDEQAIQSVSGHCSSCIRTYK